MPKLFSQSKLARMQYIFNIILSSLLFIPAQILKSIMITLVFLLGIANIFSQPSSSFSFYSSSRKDSIRIHSQMEWEVQRWHIRHAMEKVMGNIPESLPLDRESCQFLDTLEAPSYFRYQVLFPATDNEMLTVYLYKPKRVGIGGKLAAILALHPTGDPGKKIVDGEGLPNRAYARELAERGYVVIAPDYPGFGDLKDFDFTNPRYESGTMAGIYYHRRCLDLLEEIPEVDEDRIGVIGHSLGGHNAMFLAAFDERIKVIVASCGWTRFANYDIGPGAVERYGGRLGPWAQDRYMPRIRDIYQLDESKIPFDFHEIISLLAPRPFFSNSPVMDSNFNVDGVKNGIKEAMKVYQFLHVPQHLQVRYPNAEHDFPTEVRKEAYEFLDRHLQHIPSIHILE